MLPAPRCVFLGEEDVLQKYENTVKNVSLREHLFERLF